MNFLTLPLRLIYSLNTECLQITQYMYQSNMLVVYQQNDVDDHDVNDVFQVSATVVSIFFSKVPS